MSEYSNNERRDHINQLIVRMSLGLAMPLFLGFWFIDCIYIPEYMWRSLALRLCSIPMCFGIAYLARRANTLAAAERIGVLFVSLTTLFIYLLTYPTRGLTTPYIDGLNLIALAVIPFLPFRRPALIFSIFIIYAPFVFLAFFQPKPDLNFPTFAAHLALNASTVIIALVLRTHTFRMRENERLAEAKLGLMARQVAHDIRSPVSALKIAAESLEAIPEENRRLIQFAIARIEQISKDLLLKGKKDGETGEPIEVCALNPLLEKLFAEKRLQFQHKTEIRIEFEASGNFSARVDPHEFSRAMSNLLNNAMEAIDERGRVVAKLTRQGPRLILSIEDNGKGIPAKTLEQLGEGKVNSQKSDGNGIGYWHARRALESWGGTIRIASTENRGTSVTITLPAA